MPHGKRGASGEKSAHATRRQRSLGGKVGACHTAREEPRGNSRRMPHGEIGVSGGKSARATRWRLQFFGQGGFCDQEKIINSRIFHRTDRSVQPGDEKKTCPNLNAGRCIAQPRTHTRTPGNTPGLGQQGHAGRRMKPAGRLGPSAVRIYAFPSSRLSGAFSEKYSSTLLFPQGTSTVISDHFLGSFVHTES